MVNFRCHASIVADARDDGRQRHVRSPPGDGRRKVAGPCRRRVLIRALGADARRPRRPPHRYGEPQPCHRRSPCRCRRACPPPPLPSVETPMVCCVAACAMIPPPSASIARLVTIDPGVLSNGRFFVNCPCGARRIAQRVPVDEFVTLGDLCAAATAPRSTSSNERSLW